MNREEQDYNEEQEEQIINEEYKVWKKNTPYLYDTMIAHSLDWPSLTVDWFPSKEIVEDYGLHKLVFGTSTTNSEQNHLIVANVKLPLEETLMNPETSSLLKVNDFKIRPVACIPHEGEVNKARVMPQHPQLVATKSPNAMVYIFDCDKRALQCSLQGHCKEGFGLSWNTLTEGYLASGSDDHLVCIWDINQPNRPLCPLRVYSGHSSVVNDVSWSLYEKEILVSVGDDRKLIVWDTRQEQPAIVVDAHFYEINSVDCNHIDAHLIATGSVDKTVAIWDKRNLANRLCQLEFHKDSVCGVRWAPFSQTMIASTGSDRRVLIWDLGRIGDHCEDGPPELLFIHGGHTSRVTDVAWNANDQFMVASTAEDNILQVWQMSYALIAPPEFNVSLAMDLDS